MTLGIGLIGAGMIGQMCHLAPLLAVPGCRVVALAELRPELGRRAAARFGVPTVYKDHHDLLADPAVEAVVVVTRRNATGPLVLEALSAGRHVLSEKPMAHRARDARRLVEAARGRDLTYAIGCMKRHDGGVILARTLVTDARRDDRYGRLLMVRGWCWAGATGSFGDGFEMTEESRPAGLALWPSGPDWLPETLHGRYDWFLNVNVHLLNLVRYVTGATPKVVTADFSHETGATICLDFGPYPGVLTFSETGGEDWHEGLELVFERAVMRLDLPAPFRRDRMARVTLNGEHQTVPEALAGWAFQRQAAAFVADVLAGREPIASGADSVNDLDMAEAAWRLALPHMR